jgi:hypothetical protein
MKELIASKIFNLMGTKFMGFIAATIMLWNGKIDQMIWVTVAAAYMGADVAGKYLEAKKGG